VKELLASEKFVDIDVRCEKHVVKNTSHSTQACKVNVEVAHGNLRPMKDGGERVTFGCGKAAIEKQIV